MKRKMKITKLILTGAILSIIILPTGKVEAALQANPNTQNKKTDAVNNWIINFRQMEKTGEAMGLSETLNSDLTASSASNGIDIHMMKATEYGAIVILSASGYGNPSNSNNITTTTGNNTGIILNANDYEFVAGGIEGLIFSGINSKYYDAYTTSYESAKRGDGLGTATTANPGTARWHSSSYNSWPYADKPYFYRGVFAFSRSNARETSRGVAICGEGL